jgi:predicted Rossmann fold flavoprotein
MASTKGNLIFTEWGLNGPAVMDLSHYVDPDKAGGLVLSLNLLATFQEEFDQLLAQERASAMPVRVFLGAFFSPKVASIFLKNANLAKDVQLSQVEDSALEHLIDQLKDTRLPVKGLRGFEYCQVSAGGVPVNEVDPQTLESRRMKGLYLTGETLDVVGPCGGYNLHFAFASGALAGKEVQYEDQK